MAVSRLGAYGVSAAQVGSFAGKSQTYYPPYEQPFILAITDVVRAFEVDDGLRKVSITDVVRSYDT